MPPFRVTKWGNSLALRIPGPLARQAALDEGTEVDLSVAKDGALVVRAGRRRFKIEELVKGLSPQKRRAETDWGGRRGRESW